MIALTDNTTCSVRKLIAMFIWYCYLYNFSCMAQAITVQDVKTNPRYKDLCNGTAWDNQTNRAVPIAAPGSAASVPSILIPEISRPILTEQEIMNNPRYGKIMKPGHVWDRQTNRTVPFEACAPKGSNLSPPSPALRLREDRPTDIRRRRLQGGSVLERGVQVTGAGRAQVDGWYRRRKNSEGPPRKWRFTAEQWAIWTQSEGGRPWYEKDDGCFIYYSPFMRMWKCCRGSDGSLCYEAHGRTALPPAGGWVRFCRGVDPAPAFRVVS